MRIIIFGTGYFGKALYQKLRCAHSVVGFASNYIKKEEDTLFGLPVLLPAEALRKQIYDAVVIASTTGAEDIFQQCLALGVGHMSHCAQTCRPLYALGVPDNPLRPPYSRNC